MFKRMFILLFCSLCSMSLVAAAQTGIVRGRVTSVEIGDPLPAAEVAVKGTDISGRTDSAGEYSLLNVPAGEQTLVISCPGFIESEATVRVPVEGTATRDVELESELLELGEVTVKGLRRGQARSIGAKREAVNVKDVISADEFGLLPTEHIMAAAQTLPGFSSSGALEWQPFNIRGTAGKLNIANIDGENIATALNWDGSGAAALGQLSEVMLSGIELIKSSRADLDAQAIGGAVNLKTLSAFDRRKPFVIGSFRGKDQIGVRTAGQTGFSWRGNVIAGTRLLKDKVGITVSVDRKEDDLADVEHAESSWQQRGEFWYPAAAYTAINTEQPTSTALNMRVDFRPKPQTSVYLNLNDVRKQVPQQWNEHHFWAGELAEGEETDETPQVVRFEEGWFGDNVSRWGFPNSARNTMRITLGSEHGFGAFKLDGSLTHSGSLFNEDITRGYWVEPDKAAGPGILELNPEYLGLPYRLRLDDPDYFKDPANWRVTSIWAWTNRIEQKVDTVKANLLWRGRLRACPVHLKTGVKCRLDAVKRDAGWFGFVALKDFTLEDYTAEAGDWQGSEGMFLRWDPLKLDETFWGQRNDPELWKETTQEYDLLNNDYEVKENVYAGYLMGGIKFANLEVEPGLRVEATNLKVDRYLLELSEEEEGGLKVTPQEIKNSYVDFSPSVNAKFEVKKDVLLRGAASRTLARPDWQETAEASTSEYWDDPAEPGKYRGWVWVGNPELKPWKSTNLDLAVEWYPRVGSLVSLGGFYKDIRNPIYRIGWEEENLLYESKEFTLVEFYKQMNSEWGKVYGVELNGAQLFPKPLHNFGIAANVALQGSGMEIERGGKKEIVPMWECTPVVLSVIPFFQKGGFSIRPVLNYRGKVFRSFAGTSERDEYLAPLFSLDLSVNYDTRLLRVTLEGWNLANAPCEDWFFGEPYRVGYSYSSGRKVSLKVSAKI